MKRRSLLTSILIIILTVTLTLPFNPFASALIPDADGKYLIPDYFGDANWAYSPQLTKFMDELPGLGAANDNALGQYIPIAVADETTYSGSDYYEIAVIEYEEQMHSQLPPTTLRGYIQLDTSVIPGTGFALTNLDGTPILKPDGTQAYGVDEPHYLGPAILSLKDRPVRIKFYNLLPTGVDGELFIPVDTTVMGAGDGPIMGNPYSQNRSNIHLHGNNTVWISDGTPHQWITPSGEDTMYPQGVSVRDVPDMNPSSVSSQTDGTTTLYYTNAQSARLMFYHDHSYGITRLNVYAGEAAPYVIMDDVENDLITGSNDSGVNPLGKKYLPDVGIPLVIQDKTFVDAATIMDDDPTWAWGTNQKTYDVNTPYTATTGDLWYPHVYSPAQNPWAADGANPFGRWMYGPWFWPPTDLEFDPIPNPYYDPANAPWEPPLIPATPNPSAPGESFMDTPVVNGTAYPFMLVDPKTYRFRILNAANDRFFNLQLYIADDTYLPGTPGFQTEVKMIPVDATTPTPSHIHQIMPDPATKGPDWIQIGTEGGFLPAPVVIPSQPITWNLGLTAFNAGNVDQHSLLLGSAERADVLVDFSLYAGKTLILYNDAPAPFPANDTRYDYHTGNPDETETGGTTTTLPGKGPNTRTIMQIRVADIAPQPAYDLPALAAVFAKSPTNPGVFATAQEPIIIPQAAYDSAYGTTLPADAATSFIQQDEFDKTFRPINKDGVLQPEVTLNIEPKALQDEMGEVYDEYGRMSGFLGLTSPQVDSVKAPFLAYGFASPPVDIVRGAADLEQVQIGSLDDGTQIWRITHNGVDTHPIHTHLFNAQLVNRVAWDGAMIAPDANELGWKETFRVNPLEHTIIALRPKYPSAAEVPFDVPNSVRLIDPTMPEGEVLKSPPPAGWFTPEGNPVAQILNHKVNYGWEYVYHCHILSHEEMDMMHVVSFAVPPKMPTGLAVSVVGNGALRRAILTWVDASSNETNYIVQRATSPEGSWTTLATLPANTQTYSNLIGNSKNAYFYRIYARNIVGDVLTPGFPTVTVDSATTGMVSVGIVQTQRPAAPTGLTAFIQTGPQILLTWQDNAINENGFLVQRSTNGGITWANLVTVAARNGTGAVSYTDTAILPGGNYRYRVAATNTAGNSNFSNIATAIIPTAPAAPSLVSATAAISGNRFAVVTITWKDNSTNETNFVIERATDALFTANVTSATVGANVKTYTSGKINRNTQYYFRVRAISSYGQSARVNALPFPIRTP